MKKIKIGKELTERMRRISSSYAITLGCIVTRSIRAFDRSGVALTERTQNATRGGTVVSIATDKTPELVREIIHWNLSKYEKNPPKVTEPFKPKQGNYIEV